MDNRSRLIDFFHDSGTVIDYRPGDIILRAGDTPSGVYMVKSGAIKAYYYNQTGEPNIHTIYRSHELFPIAWAIKNVHLPSNFAALNTVAVVRVPLDDFKTAIATDIKLSNDMTDQITSQFIGYVYRIGNLQYSNAHERIVFQLILLSQRFGIQTGATCVIDIPLTHTIIASTVNVARETASRSLQRLARKGILSQIGKQITILDVDKLYHELRDRTLDPEMLRY